MAEERTALERITSEVIDWGPGAWIDRMAPLSVGAVAGSVAILAGGAVVRTLMRRSPLLRWAGIAAAVPLGLWILTQASASDESDWDGDGSRRDELFEAGASEAPDVE